MEIDGVFDLRGIFAEIDIGPNLLAADEHAFVFCEPNITDDAAVMPPVIPDVAPGLQLESEVGDAGFGGAIVELDRDDVLAGLEEFGDVEKILAMAAFVFAGFQAVDPNARKIKGCGEMKFDVFLRGQGGQIERAEIPGDAFVVVVLADVPGVRDADRFGASGNSLEPALGFAVGLGIDAEKPWSVKIDSFGGADERGKRRRDEKCKKKRTKATKSKSGLSHEISQDGVGKDTNVNAIICPAPLSGNRVAISRCHLSSANIWAD